MKLKKFTFNPFSENTYVLYDNTGQCVIVDPGCSYDKEENELKKFIEDNKLTPVRLLNTHCHIDHVLGNRFVSETWNLPLEAHIEEQDNIENAGPYAAMFGMPDPKTPAIAKHLAEGDTISFGDTKMEVLFTPGHSPGHVVFYDKESENVIGGDVLFRESIGRTDLAGGDFETLIRSIRNKLFVLAETVTVYPGHGPETTIGHEKQRNPFLWEVMS